MYLACERSSQYRATKKLKHDGNNTSRITGTKKCGCPFDMRAHKFTTHDKWTLTVVCGLHNHPPAEHFEGHSYAERLSKDEKALLMDMSKSMGELHTHKEEYITLYGSYERFEELTNILSYFEDSLGYSHWMTMPDMGHLVASCYNLVLYHLSLQQCLTFLPLRTVLVPQLDRHENVRLPIGLSRKSFSSSNNRNLSIGFVARRASKFLLLPLIGENNLTLTLIDVG
ncbi:uncharacterized protein LOC114310040 [Camellia sinensis]|uniref:uncharacterized protein LOC114310040 n=1 Tax=Camellia sinensis TaxID=4442 RepID=UPI0010357854|nr:uncharacterized protein LOC114310040 [Camellia sinensis]